MNRSQVMQTLSYLSDVIGPRLTASPGMKRANEWTRDTMTKWGLQNAHLEAWGPFGRGWTLKAFFGAGRLASGHSADRLSESLVAQRQGDVRNAACPRQKARSRQPRWPTSEPRAP